MTQQLDMIDEAAIRHKMKAIKALHRLQFDPFRTELLRAIRIQPYMADLRTLKSVGEYLKNRFRPGLGVPNFLAQVWYDIPAAVTRNELTPGMGRYTESLLTRIAQVQKVPTGSPFIDKKEKLHRSCLMMSAGNYETARKLLLETLTSTHPLRADLWGYYGDINILLGYQEEARAAYLRALVLQPQQLDLFRLQDKELRRLCNTLSQKRSPVEACSLLFTHGWLNGLFNIPRGNTWLARQSQYLQDKMAEELPLYKHERWHRFSICLFLDQSKPVGEIDYEAREQMMELDGELFEEYLGKLG